MARYQVWFDENGGEYLGYCYVEAESVNADIDNPKAFYADGVHVEMDERVIEVVKLPERKG